jgi:predicted NBD/HSP70 family sugar kinase/biotin operon repressor
MPTRSGDLQSLRELNRLRVIDALQDEGTASRAEIARRTGLSRTTVSTIVADLQRSGLIVEHSAIDEDGREGQQGRPGVLLALDPSAGAAVGVDFDHDRIRVAVADLSRTVLAELHVSLDVDHDAERALDTAARLVDDVLAEAGIERARVLGAGMALAGPVDHEHRRLHRSAILSGWTEFEAGEFERRIGMPVHLDNDSNLGALAESTLGACRGVAHAAYVSISSGIGAGLIVDGQVYRGHRGTAGEIGHVLMDPSGVICRCGNRGCLETLASAPAVVDLISASRARHVSIEDVLALARDGDAGARRAIGDAGRAVGSALAALVNALNPEMVVVGGDLSEAGDVLLEPLRASLERSALPVATESLTVRVGALGERANLLGAIALVTSQSKDLVAARVASAGALA